MISVILRKELAHLSRSTATWWVLGLLLVLLAWQFIGRIDPYLAQQAEQAKMATPLGLTESVIAPAFNATAWMLLLLAPMLAMRLISEEKRHRTLSLLTSAPVSIAHIVLGKFFALLLMLCAVILFSVLLAASLAMGGALDWGLIAANVCGLILFASAVGAFCLFVSSLSAHPLMAALAALILLLLAALLPVAATNSKALQNISPFYQFEPFNLGVIDAGSLAYFMLLTFIFLWLTGAALDRARRHL
jgi:ABC-2 type transport system permease protein